MLPPVTLDLGESSTLKCPDFRWDEVYGRHGKHRTPGLPGWAKKLKDLLDAARTPRQLARLRTVFQPEGGVSSGHGGASVYARDEAKVVVVKDAASLHAGDGGGNGDPAAAEDFAAAAANPESGRQSLKGGGDPHFINPNQGLPKAVNCFFAEIYFSSKYKHLL